MGHKKSIFGYILDVLKHKWFVFVECIKFGVPWLGITHDLSKFFPLELFAYYKHFHRKDATTADEWHLAVLHHYHVNKHHPQYWLFRITGGSTFVLKMPERYVREMVADWIGASRAFGNDDAVDWYMNIKKNLLIHEETRELVENLLKVRYEDLFCDS